MRQRRSLSLKGPLPRYFAVTMVATISGTGQILFRNIAAANLCKLRDPVLRQLPLSGFTASSESQYKYIMFYQLQKVKGALVDSRHRRFFTQLDAVYPLSTAFSTNRPGSHRPLLTRFSFTFRLYSALS